jgi:hypothetical protein
MMECACNCDELEDEAIVAIIAYGKSLFTGHYHTCPPDLAQRARWS